MGSAAGMGSSATSNVAWLGNPSAVASSASGGVDAIFSLQLKQLRVREIDIGEGDVELGTQLALRERGDLIGNQLARGDGLLRRL